jgi:predicted RNase H-like HicB family nuclease
MKESARYLKIVEWSEEDGCFVGQCPGIIGPCCHGDDEAVVYAELCEIVEEWLDIMASEQQILPPPTVGRGIPERILELA